MSYEVRFSRTGSVTPSDRGFSLRGVRTEGGGHKPVSLSHFSGEAPGDSGASPGEQLRGSLSLWGNGHPAGGPEPRGDGMASRWLAAYLQATTTRQKSQLSSDRTNQVIVNNANCLVQAQLAGGARFRTVDPVVSYSPVRARGGWGNNRGGTRTGE